MSDARVVDGTGPSQVVEIIARGCATTLCRNFASIDWLIVGGECGAKARPMDLDWVRDLRDRRGETALFFKQVGGRTPKAGGRLLDGRTWDEYPSVVSEFVYA